MATTRVQITPIEGGPNDAFVLNAQDTGGRNKKFSGSGSDTDIIVSSARAYVSALNKMLTWHSRRREQAAKGQKPMDLEAADGLGDAEPAGPPKVVVADKLKDHSP
jgi:LeuA allosteric (dimerisation) domain